MEKLIVIFAEATKGDLGKPYFLSSLEELYTTLGEPPEDSLGIPFLIKMLSTSKKVCFFRVKEEGVIEESYQKGFSFLSRRKQEIFACFMPKVSEKKTIRELVFLKPFLFFTEKDLFDYLSS